MYRLYRRHGCALRLRSCRSRSHSSNCWSWWSLIYVQCRRCRLVTSLPHAAAYFTSPMHAVRRHCDTLRGPWLASLHLRWHFWQHHRQHIRFLIVSYTDSLRHVFTASARQHSNAAILSWLSLSPPTFTWLQQPISNHVADRLCHCAPVSNMSTTVRRRYKRYAADTLADAQTTLGKKNTFYGTPVSVPLSNFCEKLHHAKFHWNRAIGCWVVVKNDFKRRTSAVLSFNKKLSYRRQTARCFLSLDISLSHSRSVKVISIQL